MINTDAESLFEMQKKYIHKRNMTYPYFINIYMSIKVRVQNKVDNKS